MNREKILAKINELVERSLAPDCTVEELRSVKESIKEYKAMLADCDVEARAAAEAATIIEAPPANAVRHNAEVIGAFTSATAKKEEKRDENPLESMEYRQAFRNFVQRGVKIPTELRQRIADYRASLPEELRAGVAITTNDTEAAIPLVLMREIINTRRVRYGNLYAKTRKMSVAAGINFAVCDLAAEFHWVDDDTVSPTQKTDKLAKISFSYFGAECRIARSYLSAMLTLTDFEAKLTEVISTAYFKAMDIAIVRGTGSGMPLGIINDPRITKVVTMTAAQINNWTEWKKKFFGAEVALGYDGGEFIFQKATVNAYLETMHDANNNPIYRVATGLEVGSGDAENPSGVFYGHDLSMVENTVLPSFESAESGDVIGIFWQPEEYAINEPLGFSLRRYNNEDANQIVDKAFFIADGKVLNPEGFVLIKKA